MLRCIPSSRAKKALTRYCACNVRATLQRQPSHITHQRTGTGVHMTRSTMETPAATGQQYKLPCPRRMFVSDAHTVESASQTLVRIMGCVVDVSEQTVDTVEKMWWLSLDDGTGRLLRTTCSLEMVTQLVPKAQQLLGKTLDCVGTIQEERESQERVLVAETVAIVGDVHAQYLRWLEICLQAKTDNTFQDKSVFMAGGYEPPSLCAADVARFIRVGASDGGVTLEDLALVGGVDESTMRDLVQELQVNGEIYQHRRGTYMPL